MRGTAFEIEFPRAIVAGTRRALCLSSSGGALFSPAAAAPLFLNAAGPVHIRASRNSRGVGFGKNRRERARDGSGGDFGAGKRYRACSGRGCEVGEEGESDCLLRLGGLRGLLEGRCGHGGW